MRDFLAANVNFLLVLCGLAVLYVGVSSLSRPVANIVLGCVLVGFGTYPYLRVRKS